MVGGWQMLAGQCHDIVILPYILCKCRHLLALKLPLPHCPLVGMWLNAPLALQCGQMPLWMTLSKIELSNSKTNSKTCRLHRFFSRLCECLHRFTGVYNTKNVVTTLQQILQRILHLATNAQNVIFLERIVWCPRVSAQRPWLVRYWLILILQSLLLSEVMLIFHLSVIRTGYIVMLWTGVDVVCANIPSDSQCYCCVQNCMSIVCVRTLPTKTW